MSRAGKEYVCYIWSKRVPCCSIATITDSRADCCVSLDERFVATVGKSACNRLVWFASSCVCSRDAYEEADFRRLIEPSSDARWVLTCESAVFSCEVKALVVAVSPVEKP